jgi:hypothetical protein
LINFANENISERFSKKVTFKDQQVVYSARPEKYFLLSFKTKPFLIKSDEIPAILILNECDCG